MGEGGRLVAGEAILSEAASVAPSREEGREQGREQGQDDALEDLLKKDLLEKDLLENLVQQHARLVYRIAYAVLRRHHDAEDATQETFVRVLRYSRKLAGVEDHKTWLARIAWRVAVDRNRQQGRKREIPLDDPEKPLPEVASSDAAADDALHGAQVSDVLERMIAALPEKLRQPLILSTIEEMSPREVAATLGINEAAVRSRVFRARQILREKLAGRVERKTGR
ncbi:MAG: RNA polymerase sigma factor [Candidatus Sulfotelmatobacter sp.]|jgi:RNA polymerase sigma-70 factor (ECF subfamily)